MLLGSTLAARSRKNRDRVVFLLFVVSSVKKGRARFARHRAEGTKIRLSEERNTLIHLESKCISSIFKQNSNFLIKVRIIVKLLCNEHNEVGRGLDAFCLFSTFNRMPILNYVFTKSAV